MNSYTFPKDIKPLKSLQTSNFINYFLPAILPYIILPAIPACVLVILLGLLCSLDSTIRVD
jgi:hypothetical protein